MQNKSKFLALFSALLVGPSFAVAQTNFRSEAMPYGAFDRLSTLDIAIPNATLNVGFAPGKLKLSHPTLLAWLKDCATIVSRYYGTFPVSQARILIVPSAGRGIKGGQAFGYRGAAIRLYIGKDTQLRDLHNDWVAIHEMIHLALPSLNEKHYWLSEGLAVYIESIARVQNHSLREQKIWQDFMHQMPKGLPRSGDKGLDHTPTWGRRYWGGALFCLMADIKIRQQTNNKIGLQGAMQEILKKGGNIEHYWSIKRILQTADQATGTQVMSQLYEEWHATPVSQDMPKLWKELGVSNQNGTIKLSNTAPLSHIRQAIVKPLS